MRPASTARAAVLAACAAGCGLHPGRAYYVAPTVAEGPRLRSTPLDRQERAEEAPAPALGTRREHAERAAPVTRTLRNGVRVAVLPRHDFPAATVVFGVRHGRRVPPAVAAMYASAAAYPLGDWAWMVEPANGARREIYVSHDAVMLRVTAVAPSILGSLATLLPSFLKPPTNEDALALARARLERSASMHDPAVKARRALYASLFPEAHPYASLPSAYSAAELRKVDAQALDAFVSAAIAADTVFVVASGDVDADALVRVLEHGLGALPARAADAADARGAASCDRSLAPSDVRSGSVVAYGYATVPASHRDAPALEVLAAVAGGDMSGRFNVALRHGLGATYGVHVSSTMMLHAGVFEIRTTLAPTKVDEALTTLDSEIERLRESPLTDEELRVAKVRAIYTRMAVDPALALASTISVEAKPLSALEAVTAADVQAVARRYLDASKRCAVTAEAGSRASR